MTTKSRIEILKADLDAAYGLSKWHSFKSAVKGLSDDEARWTPSHYKGFPWMDGSILRIIFHLGGDIHYQLDHAMGEKRVSWATLEERFQKRGGDLKAALAICEEGYRKLLRALDLLNEAELSRTYQPPEGAAERTSEAFFRMMIEHLHYHAGQIVYIRSMWKGLPK